MMLALIHLGVVLFLAGMLLILLSSKRSPLPSSWITLHRHFENGLFLAALGAGVVLTVAVIGTILKGLGYIVNLMAGAA